MDAIRASHLSRVGVTAPAASLDDRTWDDLHLDAVFAAIDRTESTLGQQALYHRLRTAPVADHLDAFERLVTKVSVDVPTRERAQLALARLQDPVGYDLWWLLRPGVMDTPAWYVVFPLLAGTTLFLLLLASSTFGFWPVLVAALIVNMGVHRITGTRVDAVAGAFRQVAPLVATAQALQFMDGDELAPIIGAIRSDTPRLARLKTIARWLSGDPLMLRLDTTWTAISISDFFNVVYAYLNLAFLLDGNSVFFGARLLRARAPSLLRIVAAMGELDAAISVASFRAGTAGWTRPRLMPAGAPAVLSGLCHPLVNSAVPNSIGLGPPNGVLVTGSNMSGKSTWLRTVGVSVVMAQTLNTCLAAEYTAPVLRVRSCIGRTDDLQAGKSYYLVEVEALLDLVKASQRPEQHLFLLDELFRGTNAVERIAAGEAVLRELVPDEVDREGDFVIAATHDGELVDLLRDRYVSCHFGDSVGTDGLRFDYRLLPGPATSRNAISLLEINGAPESLVRRARERAAALDAEREPSSSK